MHLRARARATVVLAGSLSVLALPTSSASAAPYDWPQFNGSARHTGDNTSETVVSPANVAQLRQLFQVTLPAVADSTPVVLTSVATSAGVKDLLFVNTKQGRLIALDALTGATVWDVQHGNTTCTSPPGPCITESSPAVDPGRAYVYSYGLDGYVHKHAVA